MTSAEVKQLAGVFLSQVKGIFKGIEQLPDAYVEVERREAVVAEKEKRLASYPEAIASKERDLITITAQVTKARESMDALEAQLADKEAFVKTRSAQLDAEIKAKSDALASVKEALAAVHQATGQHIAG